MSSEDWLMYTGFIPDFPGYYGRNGHRFVEFPWFDEQKRVMHYYRAFIDSGDMYRVDGLGWTYRTNFHSNDLLRPSLRLALHNAISKLEHHPVNVF